MYRPRRCRYEQWLRAGKPGLPRPAYVTAIRIFKEELLSKRVVEKAAQLVARANPNPNANATPNPNPHPNPNQSGLTSVDYVAKYEMIVTAR